jgi:uncharacterized protein (DUF2237 family)
VGAETERVTLTPPLTPPTRAAGAPPRPSDVLSAGLERDRRARDLVERLIAEPSRLGPDFVPIRRLQESSPSSAPVLGWKATGRGEPGTDAADALGLLAQASSVGLVERLDWAFRCHTFDVALDAGMVGELHLTPEPETFGGACPPRLAVSWLRGRRALDVCAELHEDAFVGRDRLLAAAEEMAGWGWHLVVADLSTTEHAVTAASMLSRLRPAYVQVDMATADRDPVGTQRWIEAGQAAGASVLAVGISTQDKLERAIALGAVHGRGPLVGMPVSVPRS